ncbi:MAG: hypothetical protein ABSA26_04815, partial [Thermoguttaceae bacterium]
MANKYGPWATLIDAGGRPQLSAFWKRRLTMLVPASRTSPVLSRCNLLWLCAGAMLMCLLPTLFFTPAAAQEKKPADDNTTMRGNTYFGTTTLVIGKVKPDEKSLQENGATASDQQPPTEPDFKLPWETNPYHWLPVYTQLEGEDVRKELKLSGEQEQKLRDIAANFQMQYEKLRKVVEKGYIKSPPGKEMTKEIEAAKAEFMQNTKGVNKQIEGVLTTEQIAALRKIVVQDQAAGLVRFPTADEKIGLSDQQKKDLAKLTEEMNKKKRQLQRDNFEKMLAVLSPQQREKLHQVAGFDLGPMIISDSAGHFGFMVYIELIKEDVRQELGLSAEQFAKLQKIDGKYDQMAAKEFSEIKERMQKENEEMQNKTEEQQKKGNMTLSAGSVGRGENKPDEERKINKLGEQMRGEIDSLLTPEQLATLKKISLDENLSMSLTAPRILKQIEATQDQRKELSRLEGERHDITSPIGFPPYIREIGEKALQVLTPQQREKFMNGIYHGLAEFDLSEFADHATFMNYATFTITSTGNATDTSAAAKSSDEKQSLTKSGGGSVILWNSSADAPAKESAPGGGSPYIAPSEYISLPAYSFIGVPKMRKQLGLSPQQEKKLREISAAFIAEEQKFEPEVMNISPKDREAKVAEFKRKFEELRTNGRKQIEEVVTPQQLDACKKLVFPLMAYGMLFDPQVIKIIEITPEQKEKLKQLSKEMGRGWERESQDKTERGLALLSPEQLQKLRVEVERHYLEIHEPVIEEPGTENTYSGSVTVSVGTLTLTAGPTDYAIWSPAGSETETGMDSETDFVSLSVYENLGMAEVRKTLGLNADQEKQLKEIASNSRTEMKKLNQALQKQLAPEEQQQPNQREFQFRAGTENGAKSDQAEKERQRKQREFRRESARLTKDVRQKIEALLTPQQLAGLKDILFRMWSFGSLINPDDQKNLGLSDQQKTDL